MYTKQVFVDESGALWSLSAHHAMGQLHGDWVVEYPPGEWVQARQEGTLLFVDEPTDNHPAPCYSYPAIQAWECKVLGISYEYRMLIASYVYSSIMLRDFWDKRRMGVRHPQCGGTFYTTRLVKEVKLTRRINGND